MPRLDAALAMAERGIPVFPLRPGEKTPHPMLAGGGVYAATRDPSVIREWWRRDPAANVGAAVGAAEPPVSVLDVDGPAGLASLAAHEVMFGPLDNAFVVETPSGGLHYYVRETWSNTVGKLGPGLDTRGPGGYVVAPGSTVGGVSYRVADWSHGDMARVKPCPSISLPAGPARAPAGPNPDGLDVPDASPMMVERALAWLDRAEPAVEGNGGDARTFETACRVRDFGLSPAQTLDAMQDWNARCSPPWDADDLATKVRNAYLYAKEAPRMDGGGGLPEGLRAAVVKHRPRFKGITLAELDALPPPEWLVPALLPAKGLSLLVGPYGSFKSFAALTLALDVAAGTDTMGLRGPGPFEPQPVLYVAGEGAFGIGARAAAWAEYHGYPLPDTFRLVTDMPQILATGEVTALLDSNAPAALVILDTLATMAVGLDENAAQDMGRVVAAMGGIRDRWGCNVMVVHHANKQGGVRGSVALPAGVDTVLTTEADGDALTVTITKQKDAARIDPINYVMKTVDTPKGRSLTLTTPPPTTPAADPTRAAREILAELDEAAADAEAATVLDACEELLRAATVRTISVGALADMAAQQLGDDPEHMREVLRSARGRARFRDRTVAADARGRPTRFNTR